MSVIEAIENERCAYRGSDPAQLRQRMVERDSDDDVLLLLLRRLDDDDLWEALQGFSETELRYLCDLMERSP